ncbi:TIGR01459 family HAD-type hydrolase [Rhodobacter sp. Har01]|uniref:TIGR01459 family HAD-type hydrolase n=1 Tax=Rhodobacter sp. Har01 TaxID=2883999 RepID=UPI001D063D92|nr:TIGR01459 family HAD-type hydrolase [Rhodobacter sp. Har01]MCB6179739.1 TIGR01459 family HAD-type hydrolase [Rhodobacter sp. Har01]
MSEPLDAAAAFARYEEVRARLPAATYPQAPLHAPTLAEVADRWDGFVLDAFGVLNIGDTPIPGAVERMAQLRAMGKRLVVLTNAASYTRADALAKYRRLGFDFGEDEVVSSRDVAVAHLDRVAPGAHWGAISQAGDDFHDIPARVTSLLDTGGWDRVDGFLFLSTSRWTLETRAALHAALAARPRPLVVANPDLVAPREGGLTIEPGFWAHEVIDRLGTPVHWFGKPFPEAFAEAEQRAGLPPHRLAMVGDTLHTDVLGGRAAGMAAILVTDHGLFAGRDVSPFLSGSGIVPDVIVAST